MHFDEFIEYCIGDSVVNSRLTTQPPCWRFEYEHVSGSLYLRKAIICLPVEMTNKVMQRITRDCYKLDNNIIYQKIESYQISDSDVIMSANEIEVRVFENLEYEQEKIEKVSFKTEVLNV